jgi:cysteinyl-tRNA synthetase
MEAAGNALERIKNAVSNLKYLLDHAADGEMTEKEQGELAKVAEFETKFDEAMDDDFNTADAIAAVFDLVKYANSNVTGESSAAYVTAVRDEIIRLCDILGIIAEEKEEILDEEIERLIAERQAARKAKDFARADEIRGQLLAQGITLLDTREGVKWKRS